MAPIQCPWPPVVSAGQPYRWSSSVLCSPVEVVSSATALLPALAVAIPGEGIAARLPAAGNVVRPAFRSRPAWRPVAVDVPATRRTLRRSATRRRSSTSWSLACVVPASSAQGRRRWRRLAICSTEVEGCAGSTSSAASPGDPGTRNLELSFRSPPPSRRPRLARRRDARTRPSRAGASRRRAFPLVRAARGRSLLPRRPRSPPSPAG